MVLVLLSFCCLDLDASGCKFLLPSVVLDYYASFLVYCLSWALLGVLFYVLDLGYDVFVSFPLPLGSAGLSHWLSGPSLWYPAREG